MSKSSVLLGVAATIVAGSAVGHARNAPGEQLRKLVAERLAGQPTSCISLFGSPSSQIIDGTAIVYRTGGTLYVNRPSGANTLRSDDILVTRPFGSQLCRADSVRLLDRNSGFQRGFVVLNDFVPYKKPKVRPLVERR